MRIALLEDNPTDAEPLRQCLTRAGHQVHVYGNGKEITAELRHESFDLLLLDWNTPGMNGHQVLQWVREQANLRNLPTLFVTAEDSELNVVQALNEGADDYLTKPVRCAELMARINAILRRLNLATQSGRPLLEYGDWTFDPRDKRATFRHEEIVLTNKEFDLAYFLFSNMGRLLSRGHLLEAVWGMAVTVPTRTVDTHISKVRTQCRLFPENGMRLVSVYGYGYRLEAMPGSAQ
ncbi:MAG: response regulator transcription factor [Sideroxydans sp.]